MCFRRINNGEIKLTCKVINGFNDVNSTLYKEASIRHNTAILLKVINVFYIVETIDWNETLKIKEQNIDYSTEIFLNKINELVDNFAP